MDRRAFLGTLAAGLATAGQVAARCEGYVPGLKPQNTARSFVGQTYDEIVDRGFIDLALYEDFAPYSWQDGGAARGIDAGVGRIIAEYLGVEPRFRFVAAGENLDADLLNYVWKGATIGGRVSNVMLRVPYHSELTCRIEQVVFTGQYAGERIAVAYDKAAYPDAVQVPDADGRHPDAPVPAYFRFDRVAVENDSIADFYLTGLLGAAAAANIRRARTMAEATALLASGEVMAAMGPLGQLEWGLAEGLAVHTPLLPNFAVGRWTVGLAVHHSHRDLAYAVDDAVAAAVADGRMAELHARHGLSFTPPVR